MKRNQESPEQVQARAEILQVLRQVGEQMSPWCDLEAMCALLELHQNVFAAVREYLTAEGELAARGGKVQS